MRRVCDWVWLRTGWISIESLKNLRRLQSRLVGFLRSLPLFLVHSFHFTDDDVLGGAFPLLSRRRSRDEKIFFHVENVATLPMFFLIFFFLLLSLSHWWTFSFHSGSFPRHLLRGRRCWFFSIDIFLLFYIFPSFLLPSLRPSDPTRVCTHWRSSRLAQKRFIKFIK